jgi:hypothetical protein
MDVWKHMKFEIEGQVVSRIVIRTFTSRIDGFKNQQKDRRAPSAFP